MPKSNFIIPTTQGPLSKELTQFNDFLANPRNEVPQPNLANLPNSSSELTKLLSQDNALLAAVGNKVLSDNNVNDWSMGKQYAKYFTQIDPQSQLKPIFISYISACYLEDRSFLTAEFKSKFNPETVYAELEKNLFTSINNPVEEKGVSFYQPGASPFDIFNKNSNKAIHSAHPVEKYDGVSEINVLTEKMRTAHQDEKRRINEARSENPNKQALSFNDETVAPSTNNNNDKKSPLNAAPSKLQKRLAFDFDDEPVSPPVSPTENNNNSANHAVSSNKSGVTAELNSPSKKQHASFFKDPNAPRTGVKRAFCSVESNTTSMPQNDKAKRLKASTGISFARTELSSPPPTRGRKF